MDIKIEDYRGKGILYSRDKGEFYIFGESFRAKTLKEVEAEIDKLFEPKRKKFKPFTALIYRNSIREYEKVKITSIVKARYYDGFCGRMSDNITEREFYKVKSFERLSKLFKLKKKIEKAILDYSEKNRIAVEDIAKEMGYTDEDLKNL